MTTDIVVGIDGSPNAAAALRWAVEEAKVRGTRVRAVLAWSYLGQDGSMLGVGTTEADAIAAIETIVAETAPDDGAIIDATSVNDLPSAAILGQASTAALLVVGSRGYGGIKGMVLGSTSRKIIEHATIPVVVVPHHA